MKSLRHNTIYLVSANTLQVVLSLFLSIFLARYFVEKETYGKYQQLLVVINFLVAFSSGIPLSLSYFYGKYLNFSKRILLYKRFGWSIFLLAVFLAAITIGFSGFFVKMFQNSFFETFAVEFGFLIIFKIINSFFLQLFLTRGRLSYYFSIICAEVTLTIIFVFCIFYMKLDVREIITGLLAISILKFISFIANSFLYFKVKGALLLTKTELGYILPMVATSMASLLTVYVDKFMISSILDPKSFAEYQVGAFSIPFIGIVTGSLVTALIPALSKLKAEGNLPQIVNEMLQTTRKTSLFLLPILVYCIILGNYLIRALYSDTYSSSGYIFQIYTAGYLLSVIAFAAIMNAIGLQKWVLLNTLINLSLNIVFNLLLIPRYGTFGAVYATLLSTYLGYILPIYLLKRYISTSFLEYFPLKSYLKTLILSSLLAGLILFLTKTFDINKWIVVITSIPFYFTVVFIRMEKSEFLKSLQRLKSIIGH